MTTRAKRRPPGRVAAYTLLRDAGWSPRDAERMARRVQGAPVEIVANLAQRLRVLA